MYPRYAPIRSGSGVLPENMRHLGQQVECTVDVKSQ